MICSVCSIEYGGPFLVVQPLLAAGEVKLEIGAALLTKGAQLDCGSITN